MASQCKTCGCGMPDSAPNCPTCGAAAAAELAAVPAQSAGVPVPGIPGLPTPAPAPGIPGLPNPGGGIPGLPIPQQQPQQQPTPNYMNPGAGGMGAMGGAPTTSGGEIRVSLTGDVYEVPPPSPRGTGPGGYGPPAGAAGAGPALPARRGAGAGKPAAGPMPAGRARPRYGVPAAAEEEKSGGVPLWALLLVLLVLGGGAAGGFWWWNKQQAPKRAAQDFAQALVAKDWNKVTDNLILPAGTEAQFKAMTSVAGNLVTFRDPQIGKSSISGDTATVEVSINIDAAGQSMTDKKDWTMKLVDGKWKVDASQGFVLGSGLGNLGGGAGAANMMGGSAPAPGR